MLFADIDYCLNISVLCLFTRDGMGRDSFDAQLELKLSKI
jgi:hypothetical protein